MVQVATADEVLPDTKAQEIKLSFFEMFASAQSSIARSCSSAYNQSRPNTDRLKFPKQNQTNTSYRRMQAFFQLPEILRQDISNLDWLFLNPEDKEKLMQFM